MTTPGKLLNYNYKYLPYKEEFETYSDDREPMYLGLATIRPPTDKDIYVDKFESFMGLAIIDDELDKDIYAYLYPRYLGIGTHVAPQDIDVYAYLYPRYLGIGTPQRPIDKDVYAYIYPRYLGIGTHLPKIDLDTYAYLYPRYLGIGTHIPKQDIDTFAYLYPRYLGIGTHIPKQDIDTFSYLYPRYLGIGTHIPKPDIDTYAYNYPRYLGIGTHIPKQELDIYSKKMFGPYIRFINDIDKIDLIDSVNKPSNWLWSNLSSYKRILKSKNKKNPDNWIREANLVDRNNPLTPELEKPRLLTHLIFEPITKPALSTFYITYTLEIEVEPTQIQQTSFQLPDITPDNKVFEYHTTVPSKLWTIHHNLGYCPEFIVFIDNKQSSVYTKFYHVSNDTLTIEFAAEETGFVRIN